MKILFLPLLLSLFFYSEIHSQTCLTNGITFESQSQIDNFSTDYPGCSEILGSVSIYSPSGGISNLNGLSQISSIGGDLRIQSNPDLVNLIGLENLTTVSADLTILTNDNLVSLNGLESLVEVEDVFTIERNHLITNLQGLEIFSKAWSLVIENNHSLVNLEGLSSIDSIYYSLRIWDNPVLNTITHLNNLSHLNDLVIAHSESLTDLSGIENSLSSSISIRLWNNQNLIDISALNNLTSAEKITIDTNNALTNIDGLDNIESIATRVVIIENQNLTNVQGLSSLTSIGTELVIGDSPNLSNLSGLENLTTIGDRLWIKSLETLPNLTGLNNIKYIGGNLVITDNPSLTNIEQLEQLDFIGDGINIGANGNGVGNTNLVSLKGLGNITSIKFITINNCPSLTNLKGLENLKKIDESFTFYENESTTNLSGLESLESICENISIRYNDSLNHIGAIRYIDISNLENLRIDNNPTLSICNEVSICNYLIQGGEAIINNNDSGCNDITEVLNACESNLSKVALTVFFDLNQNQIKDSTEVFIPDMSIDIQPINLSVISNQIKESFIFLDHGIYTFLFNSDNQPLWDLTTQPSSYQLTISDSTLCDSLSFGVFPNQIISNVISFINAPPARCGELITFDVHAKNIGTTITEGTIWLNIDAQIPNEMFIDIPDTIVGSNTFGWFFDTLYPNQIITKNIKLEIPTPPSVNLGDVLLFETYVDFHDLNGSATSKKFKYNTEIRCSFDPNDKLVNPNREDNLTLFEQNLIYTIRFQNTGNDEAYDIIIRDTLDPNLDLTTFRVLSTSHPNILITTLEDNQYLIFNFENIFLTDSTTNFEESQGYVSYLIKAKEGIPEETNITNTASIYFDFNPPIVTNTTENIMVSEIVSTYELGDEKMKINIYPNPVSDFLLIEKDNSKSLLFEIIDVTGRIISQGKLSNSLHPIPFTKMNAGIYFVKIIDPQTEQFIVEKIVK